MELSRHRLPVCKTTPTKQMLDDMLLLMYRLKGCLLEQPIVLDDPEEIFSLVLEQEPSARRPVWTLFAGEGSKASVLWTYVHTETDMICEVVVMSIHASKSAASIEANIKTRATEDFSWPSEMVASPPQHAIQTKELKSDANSDDIEIKTEDVKEEIISEPKIKKAVLHPNILLGHMLVESGLVQASMLDAALTLQEMVRHSAITSEQATEALRLASENKKPLRDIVTEMQQEKNKNEPKDAVDLLQHAGLVTKDDIASAKGVLDQIGKAGAYVPKGNDVASNVIRLLKSAKFINDDQISMAEQVSSSSQPEDICKALLSLKLVDTLTFDIAAQFAQHIAKGTFRTEQAIIAMHYAQRSRTNFEDTLMSLGWGVPVEH